MSIVVYWIQPVASGHSDAVTQASHRYFEMSQMSEALLFCQEKRNGGASHAGMVVEHPDSIGRPGVDSIVDGKTPDGVDYTWKKRR